MQKTDAAPILVYEVANQSEFQESVADLEEQFDTYDQESLLKNNLRLIEHIGFRITIGAEILLEMEPNKKLALSIIDSERGPKISMPEVSISEKERPIALSLSMDGYTTEGSKRNRSFFMHVGMRSLKELWKLYLSEK